MGKPGRRLIKFKPRFSLNVVYLTKGGGHWDFRFCGFGYLLGRFFRFFCVEKLRFFGLVFIVVGGFYVLSVWFSIFIKKTSVGLRVWYPMWCSVFAISVPVSLGSVRQFCASANICVLH